MLTRPDRSELATPYHTSLDEVPDGDILQLLRSGIADTVGLLESLDDTQGEHRYAPGKWSVKEVIGHLTDTERIMTCRALCFARGEKAELPGFEQDDYAVAGRFDRRTLDALASELRAVRRATVSLFEGFDDEMLMRRGRASGCEFTVRAIAYLVCGHEIHHKRILRERYL